MGIKIQGDALNAAFTRFKELADRKVQITEADLEAIVAEELGTSFVHRFDLVDLTLSGGMSSTPTAKAVVSNGDGKIEAEGSGNGMIDAAVAAIAKATGVEGRLTDFQVHAVTGGGDALGDVVLQLDAEGFKVSGRGVSTDVVEASARAYLNAVNRILRLRERGEERDVEVGP
jgi:2-isopropylmalate synthase